jgi:hypothetical protein
MLPLPQISVLKQVADTMHNVAIPFPSQAASAPLQLLSFSFVFVIAIAIVCQWCSLNTTLHMQPHVLQLKPHCPGPTATWMLPLRTCKSQLGQLPLFGWLWQWIAWEKHLCFADQPMNFPFPLAAEVAA